MIVGKMIVGIMTVGIMTVGIMTVAKCWLVKRHIWDLNPRSDGLESITPAPQQ